MKTKQERRQEAIARQEAHDKLTPDQRLKKAMAVNPNSREVKRILKSMNTPAIVAQTDPGQAKADKDQRHAENIRLQNVIDRDAAKKPHRSATVIVDGKPHTTT